MYIYICIYIHVDMKDFGLKAQIYCVVRCLRFGPMQAGPTGSRTGRTRCQSSSRPWGWCWRRPRRRVSEFSEAPKQHKGMQIWQPLRVCSQRSGGGKQVGKKKEFLPMCAPKSISKSALRAPGSLPRPLPSTWTLRVRRTKAHNL